MLYDNFKEARKAAREYKNGWIYLGRIKKGNGKGKFIIYWKSTRRDTLLFKEELWKGRNGNYRKVE